MTGWCFKYVTGPIIGEGNEGLPWSAVAGGDANRPLWISKRNQQVWVKINASVIVAPPVIPLMSDARAVRQRPGNPVDDIAASAPRQISLCAAFAAASAFTSKSSGSDQPDPQNHTDAAAAASPIDTGACADTDNTVSPATYDTDAPSPSPIDTSEQPAAGKGSRRKVLRYSFLMILNVFSR